jgi:ankyrin repeat protein
VNDLNRDHDARRVSRDAMLLEAVKSGQLQRIRDLVHAGANVDALAPSGYPLVCAAPTADVIQTLADLGAQMNPRVKHGATHLHLLASYSFSMVSVLLERGVNPNVKDDKGGTPLFYAEGAKDVQIMELLIAQGGDVNARDYDGYTALHWAAMAGHAGTVAVLLRGGADTEVLANDGTTALHIASYSGCDVEVPRLLVEYGANVNAATPTGYRPLHYAAYRGDALAVTTLLEFGADPNAKTVDGDTPLDRALLNGQMSVAKLLSQHGARGSYWVGQPPFPSST